MQNSKIKHYLWYHSDSNIDENEGGRPFRWIILMDSLRCHQFGLVQSLSHVWLFATPWAAAHQPSLFITNTQFTQTNVHWLSDAVQPSHPLSSPSPPASHLSQNQGSFQMSQLFTSGGQSIGSFSFNISPSNEHPGLISFRKDWLNLLAVQGTLKSLLQHHSSKASILQHSAFFIDQLSHPYMSTGKTITLTRQTFVGKVMSLLFNMLSRLVITFLLRSKRLLISWLQSTSAVILEPKKIVSYCFPIYLPWSDGTGCHDLSFLNVELYANFFTLLFLLYQEAL